MTPLMPGNPAKPQTVRTFRSPPVIPSPNPVVLIKSDLREKETEWEPENLQKQSRFGFVIEKNKKI